MVYQYIVANADPIIEKHCLFEELKNYFSNFSALEEDLPPNTMSPENFFNAFLAKFISTMKSKMFRKVMAVVDVDKSGTISWEEIAINAKWALYQHRDKVDSWDVDDLIKAVIQERILPSCVNIVVD